MPATPRNAPSTVRAAGTVLPRPGSMVRVWTLNVPDSPSGNLDWTLPANYPIEVVDVVVKKNNAGGAADTHQVLNGANAITAALSTNVGAGALVRAASLNKANTQITAGGTLRVTINDGGAATTDCEIDVYYIEVD